MMHRTYTYIINNSGKVFIASGGLTIASTTVEILLKSTAASPYLLIISVLSGILAIYAGYRYFFAFSVQTAQYTPLNSSGPDHFDNHDASTLSSLENLRTELNTQYEELSNLSHLIDKQAENLDNEWDNLLNNNNKDRSLFKKMTEKSRELSKIQRELSNKFVELRKLRKIDSGSQNFAQNFIRTVQSIHRLSCAQVKTFLQDFPEYLIHQPLSKAVGLNQASFSAAIL